MLSIINTILVTLWFVSALIDYAGFCYIWQLKWYRWDRVRDFLGTVQGKNFLFRYDIIYRVPVAMMLFLWPLNQDLRLKQAIIIFFVFDLLIRIYRFVRKETRRPILSAKVLLIICTSIGIEAILILNTRDLNVLIVMLLLRMVLISAVVIFVNFLTNIFKQYYFFQARKKIESCKNLKVIGITGSYGKTTVKELLYQMLSPKFKMLKTPKNINSDIGISKFILQTDFSDVDIFIVEIGAYKIGDVKLICDMVHPSIGILTAINEQHLSLFGSIKNTQQAKYELLRALPKNGLAITNSDNAYCREFLHELQSEVVTFGTDIDYNPTCSIEEIKTNDIGVYVNGVIKWKEKEIDSGRGIQTKLKGEHNMMNLAPCLLVAIYLGFSSDEYIQSAQNIESPDNLIKTFSYGKVTVLDDSYNSNPDGFVAALQVLSKYPSQKRRIVITRGMLELGDRSDELHEKIGGEIAFVADELVVITPDFVDSLRKGVGKKYHTAVIEKYAVQEILEYIKFLKDTDSIILIENRIPKLVKKELESDIQTKV